MSSAKYHDPLKVASAKASKFGTFDIKLTFASGKVARIIGCSDQVFYEDNNGDRYVTMQCQGCDVKP